MDAIEKGRIIDAVTVGVFNDVRDAYQTMIDLQAAGFEDDQIGLIVRPECAAGIARCHRPLVVRRTVDALVSGELLATLCHAEAPALADGLTNELTRIGLSEDDATIYKNDFIAGRSLVLCASPRSLEAKAFIERHGYSTTATHPSLQIA
jgi:hypothetical protein